MVNCLAELDNPTMPERGDDPLSREEATTSSPKAMPTARLHTCAELVSSDQRASTTRCCRRRSGVPIAQINASETPPISA